ncbi:MAG: FkbM family methyltransferase [Patescibacteria group bacterium]
MFRGILWKIVHPIYENPHTKNIASRIINFFKPESVIVDGHRMYIDKDDRVISLELLLSGKWEEFETELFKQSINLGDIVVDIGAHIGYYTLIAAKKVGDKGRVYAFEPLPKNFELLKKNVELNGYKNVVLINKAVSDRDGTAKLFLSNEDNFGDQRIYDPEGNRVSISIGTIKLDTFLKNKEKRINVIKMDIQGSETKTLTGASEIIRKSKKLKLLTEFWPRGLRLCGSSGREYLNLLKKSKFKIFEINNITKKVSTLSIQKILIDYPQDSLFNADLLCVKSQ